MTTLSKLKTSTKSKTNAQETNQQHLRRMMREKLVEQRELVEASIKGEQIVKTSIKYVPNMMTGELIQQQVPRQLRKWYWQEADGTVCMHFLYGSIKIPISGENTTIEVKDLSKLPATIDLVLAALEAGELDEALLAAMEKRKQVMRRIKNG